MRYEEKLLATGEYIVLATRKHWIVLLRHAFINLFPMLILASGVVFLATSSDFLPILAALVILLLPIGRFIFVFLRWWNEQYIVTNRRVIQTEGIITKRVIDSSLEKVNDVALIQSIWGRLLNYGDLEIMTASEMGVNRMRRIKNPLDFKTAMLNQKAGLGLDISEHIAVPPMPRDSERLRLLRQLEELRRRGILTPQEFEQKKRTLLDRL
ncbi:MAG: PH domain-containing protein [Anaerolineae bacterium]|nr:PH domain-containing protein [Anaerolineae bacterium]MDW8071656.1 PH domain-containing protein [Anaerolineae bacterium]